MSEAPITQANIHPLVLLSIVDHFNRVNLKQRSKRVVGALLGIFIMSKGKSMTRMLRLLIVTPFPSKKIQVNQAYGF